MHKVLNYGSALQAYALQTVINKLGHNAEIIDYIYPNEYHKKNVSQPNGWILLIKTIIDFLRGFPKKRKELSFKKFYKEQFKLSKTYNSMEELKNDPPVYDVYMTGSDQVWNPNSIHEDTSFMLSFTDSPNKVAFSASFAKGVIPEKYKTLYAAELSKYKQIYMREKGGSKIIKELIGVDSEVVFDPTLLLDKNEWKVIADKSNIKINKPYILVYVLGYMFNVYPYIYDLIKYIQQQFDMHLIVLNMSNKYSCKLSNKTIIRDASIYDFVKLFSDASLVITDSFHGTAFSLNLNIPFYSVVNDVEKADSRIVDILNMTNESTRAIKNGSDYTKIGFSLKTPNNTLVDKLRHESVNKLKSILN